MDTELIIAIVVVAVLALLAIAALQVYQNNRRSNELRERFGSEYEHTIANSDRKRDAEKELAARAQRVERLHLKELKPEDQRRFADEWRIAQANFVDDPSNAIGEADRLVQRVMDARGYPITDFEQQAADVSVDHPQVVSNYRAAHAIAEKHGRDGASTEELRQAMVHYRALFDELLGTTARA
jgi:hypothetical protein